MIYEDKIHRYVIKPMIIRCISMFHLLGLPVDVGDKNQILDEVMYHKDLMVIVSLLTLLALKTLSFPVILCVFPCYPL